MRKVKKMKCYKCRAELTDTARYCSICGAEQGFSVELLESAVQGDQEAITQLYNDTYLDVYYTIHSLIKDDDAVMDILQDSYIRGFQHLEQLNNANSFRPWMKQIAVNTAKNWLVKRRKENHILFSQLTDEESDEVLEFKDEREDTLPDVVIDREETRRLIGEIIGTLSDEQRMVVGMFYYEEMSVREIAEILECSENTVKSRLNYARKKIEGQVLELERKGTKLYALAPIPFMLLLFRSQRVQAEEISDKSVLRNVMSVCGKKIKINPTMDYMQSSTRSNTGSRHSGKAAHAAMTGKKVGTGMKVMISMVVVTATVAGVIWGNVAAVKKKETSAVEVLKEDTAAMEEITIEPTIEPTTEVPFEMSSENPDIIENTGQPGNDEEIPMENVETDQKLIDYTVYKSVLESDEYWEYAMVDLNSDGIKEIIVVSSPEHNTRAFSAYSLQDNNPVYVGQLADAGTLGMYFIVGEDGYLYGVLGYTNFIVERYLYKSEYIEAEFVKELNPTEPHDWSQSWLFEKEYEVEFFSSDDYRLLEYESTISEDKYKPGDDLTLYDFDNIYYLDPYDPDGRHMSLTPYVQKYGQMVDLAVSMGDFIVSGYYMQNIVNVEQRYTTLHGITAVGTEDTYILNLNGSVTYYSSDTDNDRSGLTYFPYRKNSHKSIQLSDYNGYEGKSLGYDFEMDCTFHCDSDNIYLDMRYMSGSGTEAYKTVVLELSQAEMEGNVFKFYNMKEKSSGIDMDTLYVTKMIFEDDKIILSYTFEQNRGDILAESYIFELT